MTEEHNLLESFMGGSTRRSVLKSGTLATAGLALGTGTAAAQDDGDVLGQEYDKALMFADQFNPNSRFVITSPVLRWTPHVQEVREAVWSEYNTRMIRYLNTGQRAVWFQAQNAEVPEYDDQTGYVVDAEGDTNQQGTPQPEVFRMHQEWSPLGASRLVTVNFTPVGEDEEDALLEQEDWWTDGDGGQTPTDGQTPQ